MRILLQLLAVISILSSTLKVASQNHIDEQAWHLRAARPMQYVPDPAGGFTCVDGTNLYTKALYGGHTLFRLETGDRPIFAAYHKEKNHNIHFTVCGVRLDSAEHCISTYRNGIRIYKLTDPAWGSGSITLTAAASQRHENAIFRIETHDMPEYAILSASTCRTKSDKFSRNGDLGVDPPHGYDPHPDRTSLHEVEVSIGGNSDIYVKYEDRRLHCSDQNCLKSEFCAAADDSRALARRIRISTPDKWINNIGESLSTAADAIWDGETYLHGAIGWRMPLAGWRGAYAGDFLGWHDRARSHFNAYAASQVTDVPPVISHPAQDTVLNLARAEKKWGTQMYSNGYICRNPGRNDQMHHYDMNLCYIDALLWHLQWTGDTAYCREIWPVMKRALQWEKRNYDPDDDGLYDAYCCIWASDALYYNGGAVTHSSALNHRANMLAAKIAGILGDDPAPYIMEAEKIRNALDTKLYMPEYGVWAEYIDCMGEKTRHTHPAVWTIYHAIDGCVASPSQAYSATGYIDRNIPHIPLEITHDASDAQLSALYTISTSDWMPYTWSINNVAFAETFATALAYWQAGRPDEATRMLKGAIIDGMYLGRSPGNIGQISQYDAARGECYRDFADPVGVLSRAVVQGLFGFTPRALDRRIEIRPGFPEEWDHAEITHPDFCMEFADVMPLPDSPYTRIQSYRLQLGPSMQNVADSVEYTVPLRYSSAKVYTLPDMLETACRAENPGTPYSALRIVVPVSCQGIAIGWSGTRCEPDMAEIPDYDTSIEPVGVTVPQNVYETQPIDLSALYNARVDDIFRNRYLSPRAPFTTLQLPTQGIGDWCHPNDSIAIDDSALRRGNIEVPGGVHFQLPKEGRNAIYTSLFDNYPDSVTVPIDGSADGIALLMAGSTNHMQCYTTNATITVYYTDGGRETTRLVPPLNWAPIDQDYYADGLAFRLPECRPQRMALKTGETSDRLGDMLNLGGPAERRVDGGIATILYLPTDPDRRISGITLATNANDAVTGLLAATIYKNRTENQNKQ